MLPMRWCTRARTAGSPQPAAPAGAELARLRAQDPPPAATPETRAALWRDAGVVRDADGLRRLLDSPHPLARLIALCALEREESRGAHLRSDFPELDPALDHRHVVLAGDSQPAWQRWDRAAAARPCVEAPRDG